MRKVIGYFLLCLSLCSCTPKITDLRRPDRESAIIIESDSVKMENARGDDRRLLRGFRAGRYVLVGSDNTGDYYLNEKPSYITLMGKDVDVYAPGVDLPPAVVGKNQYPRTLNDGGFYVQKIKGEIKIFPFYLNQPVIGGLLMEAVRNSIQVERTPVDGRLAKAILDQLSAQK
jgi:hypothetical protein